MTRAWSIMVGFLALMPSACLDIERTDAPAGAGGAAGSAGGSATSAGGAADYQPTPCIQSCMDMTPAGTASFAAVAACTDSARRGDCADACGVAPTDAPSATTCAVPGAVDSVPSCNVCIKQQCCPELTRCFGDISCITVGICASGCAG